MRAFSFLVAACLLFLTGAAVAADFTLPYTAAFTDNNLPGMTIQNNGSGPGIFGLSIAGSGIKGGSKTGDSAYFFGSASGGGWCAYRGGPGWECASDRSLKEDFEPVDATAILDRLAAMPVFEYSMRVAAEKARFLGPTAQDFAAAFHLGAATRRSTRQTRKAWRSPPRRGYIRK